MGKSHLFEIPFSRYFSCKSFSETWESHLAANSTQQKLCCMFPHNNEASTHQKQFPCKLSQFEKQNVIIPFSPPSWKGGQRIPFYRNPIFKVLFLFSVWEPKSHFIEIPFSREGTVVCFKSDYHMIHVWSITAISACLKLANLCTLWKVS